MTKTKAYEEGYEAFENGDDNPYDPAESPDEHEDWQAGYDDAEADAEDKDPQED